MDGSSRMACRLVWLGCLVSLQVTIGLGQEPAVSFRSDVQVGPRNGAGMYRYYPGRWNTIHVRLTNPFDREAVLLSTAYVGDDPAMQYGRAQWLPPQSMINTSYPVWIPVPPASRRDACDLQTQIFESGDQGDVLVRDVSGKLTTSDLVPLSETQAATGYIGPVFDLSKEVEHEAARQLLFSCRQQNRLPTTVHEMPDADLPNTPEAYSQLDELIVASDRVGDDEATIAAIREWLAAGGRLWIMLDQVDATTVERLLGDRCDIAEIDRVELNSFALQQRAYNRNVSHDSGEYELPVPFVRVSSATAKVEYRIDGWPAAFWLDYGAGRVLITTLGARGWVPPQPGPNPRPLTQAVELTGAFFMSRTDVPSLPKELQSVVEGYVGYSIPGRGLIVGLLGGFAAVLFLAVAALWSARRLEWIGVVTPGLGMAFGAVLVLTGFRHQHAVGATVGQLQFAEPVPGGEMLRVRGITGLYFPEGQTVPLAGDHGGRFTPDMRGQDGMNRRLIWTDFDRWHWENLHQPGGLRLAEETASVRLATPLTVDATLGSDGVWGHLHHGLPAPPEDAVLLTSSGRIGARLDASGKFVAGSADVLGVGQFLPADVLSDAQRRRSKVLEALLGGTSRGSFPRQPSLAYWTAPIDGGVRFGEGLQELGEALVLVPIEFRRPALGVEVTIPSPLIPIREGFGPDGTVPKGFISTLSGEWQERSGLAETWLRLQLPTEFTPLELQSLSVVVRVSGNVGRLKLGGWKAGRLHILQAWETPVGTLRAELTDMSCLSVGADGAAQLFVSGGEAETPVAEAAVRQRKDYWRIESMEVSMRARVAPIEATP